MQFLKTILASLVALAIFSLLLLLMTVGIITAAVSEEKTVVEENTILKINLKAPLREKEIENPLEDLNFPGAEKGAIGLVSLIQTVKKATKDDKIKGIFLEPGMYYQGYSGVEELRASLQEFRETGKFIVSWSENYSEKGYYLASVANKVYMAPEGYFELNGLSSTLIFFKKMFDKLGVEPEIFRVGDYKSAVEPFIRENMSEANREQMTSLLSSINNHIMQGIADSRGISYTEIVEISDQMKARQPEDAVSLHLIDGLKYRDELMEELKEQMGMSGEEEPEFISYGEYKKVAGSDYSENHIAIVIAEGDIIPGNSPDALSPGYISKYLKKVREDDRVKAVVLRVNSPGGEMQSSELIWREVKLTAEKKPVIASFSDYAASGGYYIAMGADSIVAEPTTITGSIGIFGMFFNFGEMLDKHLGITFDQVSTGEFSGMMTSGRSLTDAERAIIQGHVDKGYDTFIKRVTEGRNAEKQDILNVASGRVWTGLQAKENGLVDVLGGVNKAVEIAAAVAETEDYKIVQYPGKRDLLEELLKMNKPSEEEVALKYFGDSYHTYKKIKNLANYQGIQARLPFEIKFE